MRSFTGHLTECMEGEATLPSVEGTPNAIDFYNPDDRESVNLVLLAISNGVGTPEIVYERARQVLDDIGYLIPLATTLSDMFSDECGEEILALTQTGDPAVPTCFLYFAFTKEDDGTNDVLAEVVTEGELEEILSE